MIINQLYDQEDSPPTTQKKKKNYFKFTYCLRTYESRGDMKIETTYICNI